MTADIFVNTSENDESRSGGKMFIPDFLQTNDWKMSRFLALVLTAQAIVLFLIFLDDYGLVPLYLRQLVTFLFFSYVPGLVLLRVLRVHRLGGVLTTLLSVGASMVIMMFVGFMLNLFYLELNGPLPFTLPMAVMGMTAMILLLCGLAFLSDSGFAEAPMLDATPFLSTPAFILYSLPLVAVLATYLLNGWNFPHLQIILLLLIAAVVLALLVVRIPSQLYPVAVVCVSLAVLLHTSLVSRFVVEWADISFEYWSANSTLLNGYWDNMVMTRTNSVLSVTVLAPMLSLLSNLDLNLIFKVCYPLLLAIIPIGVFCITQERLGSRPALMAAFIIISGTAFFTEFLGLARQIIAELLLVAAVALLMHRSKVPVNKLLLVWILALGMIVSHYGVVAVVIPAAIMSVVLFLILERKKHSRTVLAKLAGSTALMLLPPIIWYRSVSDSVVFDGIKRSFEQLMNGKNAPFELMNDLGTILLLQNGTAPQTWMAAILLIIFSALSLYGLYRIFRTEQGREKMGGTYLTIAIPFVTLSLIVFLDTNLFSFISRERFLHICILFTAPLIVFGSMCAFRALDKVRAIDRINKSSLAAFGSILIIGFLVNAGAFSFAAGIPSNIEFDMDIKEVPRHSDGAFLAANFTVDRSGDSQSIFADAHRAYLLDMLGGRYDPLYGVDSPPIYFGENVHLFLSSENMENMIWLENPDRSRLNKTYVHTNDEFNRALWSMDKVYSSQEAELYYKKY